MPVIIDPSSSGEGTRTFLELQDEALGDDFDAAKYRTSVKAWINEAVRKIARRVRLVGPLQGTDTITTAAGTRTYDLPADYVRVLSLREPSAARPLTNVEIGEIDETPAGTGRPTTYAIFAGQVTFDLTPDGAYELEVRYERDSLTLVDDDDVLPLVDAYADLPVSYARARLFEREDDTEMATYWQSKFDRELLELKSDLGRQDRSRVRQVPGMWAGTVGGPRFQRP